MDFLVKVEKDENYEFMDVIENDVDDEQEKIGEKLRFIEVPSEAKLDETIEEELVGANEDPLQNVAEVTENAISSCNNFFSEFNEEDFYVDSNLLRELRATATRKRLSNKDIIKGRNGYVWHTKKTKKEILDSPPANLQPQSKGMACNVSNPLEAWQLFVDEELLTTILRYTNNAICMREGQKNLPKHKIDIIELRAWLGLNYLCGILRNSAPNNGPLEELWLLELGNAIFRSTMSYKRFQYISELVQFKDTKSTIKATIESVTAIWNMLMINCRSFYAPSSYCSVDEHSLITSDSLCSSQPFKRGMRLVTLCDAKTLYMCNAMLAGDNVRKEVEPLQLLADIRGSRRNISVSEACSSLQLAKRILQSGLGFIMALNQNAEELPVKLLSSGVELPEKLYSEQITLDNSSSDSLLIGEIPNDLDSIKLYKQMQSSCKKLQQTCDKFSTDFATPSNVISWQLDLFHTMLNYAAHNAWVTFRMSSKGDSTIQYRDFLRQLGMHLAHNHLVRRLERDKNLKFLQKLEICRILGRPFEKLLADATKNAVETTSCGSIPQSQLLLPKDVVLVPKKMEKRKRCRQCKSSRRIKTVYCCQQCERPLCSSHMISRCEDCTGIQRPISKIPTETF